MHSIRSVKSYYAAAFVLGAIIALLVVSPARSAETLRLDHRVAGGVAPLESISPTSHPLEIHGVLQ
jgi:hypothetical protein